MKAYEKLPEGYELIHELDLQKNRKLALIVNCICLIIALVMVVVAPFLTDLSIFQIPWYQWLILSAGEVVYTVLHELTHGIAMKVCGTKKIKYGFTGLYAFAGSKDYYDKSGYIMIALAPIVVFGIILAVLQALVPANWFWVVYFIQMTNLGGAAGDIYVTWKFSKFPSDILITDYGVGMKVYSKTK